MTSTELSIMTLVTIRLQPGSVSLPSVTMVTSLLLHPAGHTHAMFVSVTYLTPNEVRNQVTNSHLCV